MSCLAFDWSHLLKNRLIRKSAGRSKVRYAEYYSTLTPLIALPLYLAVLMYPSHESRSFKVPFPDGATATTQIQARQVVTCATIIFAIYIKYPDDRRLRLLHKAFLSIHQDAGNQTHHIEVRRVAFAESLLCAAASLFGKANPILKNVAPSATLNAS